MSDVSQASMLSLTAQWIDEDFNVRKAILHSQELSGSHTSQAIFNAFEMMFRRWNITKEKVHVVLCDNARNMIKTMELCGISSKYLSGPCTSVDSERLFSAAAIVKDEKRNRLGCEKAEMILFEKNNLPLIHPEFKNEEE